MPHAEKVRRGGVPSGVSLQDLQEMRDGERDPKARTILQAAIHRVVGIAGRHCHGRTEQQGRFLCKRGSQAGEAAGIPIKGYNKWKTFIQAATKFAA